MKSIYIFLVVAGCLLSWHESVLAKKISTAFISPVNVNLNQSQKDNKDNFPQAKNGGIYVVAHRGAHVGIPENSLPAFQKAIDLGCDFVEIDTRKTKDGRIVSVHNSTIDQYVVGKTGKVSDYTLAELKQMSIGGKLGEEWKDTRIPTFEEILALCKGRIGIYLDLKELLVPELLDIIRKYEMERDIIWYIPASHMDILKQLKNMCPECLPMPDPGPEKNIPKVVRQIQPRVVASNMRQLSENFVKTAHDYKIKVIVDEKEGTPSEWEKIIKWGTDGIQTDNPEALINYLKTK
uniref:glycerophosphodiester phosphodiesterase n=1 Tax=uncultured Draconibacterium sp. TaxID=1573823 RepID=UPI003217799C